MEVLRIAWGRVLAEAEGPPGWARVFGSEKLYLYGDWVPVFEG